MSTTFSLNGQLTHKNPQDFSAYTVRISFLRKAMLSSSESPAEPVRFIYKPSSDGNFRVILSERELGEAKTESGFELQILTPAGVSIPYELKQAEKTKSSLSDLKTMSDFNGRTITLDLQESFSQLNLSAPNANIISSLSPSRVRGKVVYESNQGEVNKSRLVLYGSKTLTGSFFTVGVGETDKNGNFSIEYNHDIFRRAYLMVSVSPEERINIMLRPDGTIPDFVYGIIKNTNTSQGEDDDDDCGCHSNNNQTPRLPEEEDFALSDSYSQDIGGSCVNFTTPNRALEEFSYYSIVRTTDPEIIALDPKYRINRINELNRAIEALYKEMNVKSTHAGTAGKGSFHELADAEVTQMYQPDKHSYDPYPVMYENDFRIQQINILRAERDELLQGDFQRRELNAQAPLNWDDKPTMFQATTIAHGHLLHMKQVWRADGYSMGDLLYSLPLAPGQKKQIAIFDWGRSETASREESGTFTENLENELSRDRDISEVIHSVLAESMEGSSHARTKGSSVGAGGAIGAGASGPAGPLNLNLQVGYSGGFSASRGESWSEASQSASRSLSASNMQSLRDKTMQSASAVRSQRNTVINTVGQNESMRVQTESVANYNHCHAITIQYFEVLRHFAVHNELADVQECLFVPLMMSEFTLEKIMRWKDILQSRLYAPKNLYRDLIRGFAALERHYQATVMNMPNIYYNFPTGRYCDETIQNLNGQIRLSIQVARPAEMIRTAPDGTVTGEAEDFQNWQTTIGTILNNWQSIRNKVYAADPALKDHVFQVELHNAGIRQRIVQRLKLFALSGNNRTDLAPEMRLLPGGKGARMGNASIVSLSRRFTTSQQGPVRAGVQSLELTTHNLNLPAGSRLEIHEVNVNYETNFYSGSLVHANLSQEDLTIQEKVLLSTPLSLAEMFSPRQEDDRLGKNLIKHLNNHIEYYHKVLWTFMDADRRLMMLEGYEINVPGRMMPDPSLPGGLRQLPSEKRSLASVIENRLIGIAGNSIILPVAKGYNLDPMFRFDTDEVVVNGKRISKLMYHYMPPSGFRQAPYRISVPTRGVFAEAVKGACNSCEKIDNSRFWRWEDSPIPDSPTSIQEISTDTRRVDPGNLQVKDMPSSIIQIQNGAEAPAPTGLGAAMSAITQGDAFRDITGLNQNQLNALESLKTNAANAKSFAEIAAELATQSRAINNGDKITSDIQKLFPGPENKAKREALYQELIRSQIGGGKEKEPDKKPAAKDVIGKLPELSKGISQMPGGSKVNLGSDGSLAIESGKGDIPSGQADLETDPVSSEDPIAETLSEYQQYLLGFRDQFVEGEDS